MEMTDNKLRVLYVDDEQDNILVFKSSFRRNYNIVTAASAGEAVELLKDNPVDVIISDQRMPEISGVEFLKGLPDEPINIRMILTGYSDMEAIIDAINSGKVYKYITKPWNKNELQKTIDDAKVLLEEKRNLRKQMLQVSMEKELIENLLDSQMAANGETVEGLELHKCRRKVEQLSQQVAASDKHVQLLSEIGQEIISNLTIDGIIDSTYETVNSLMTAETFGIGIYNAETRNIEFPGLIEEGVKIPFSVPIDAENRYAVWCYKNGKEVFVNNHREEFKKYFNQVLSPVSGKDTLSVIYLPLMVKDNIIGVLTVQAISSNMYTNYHLSILRNIAIYVAIALENAKTYNLVEKQKAEIEEKNLELEQKVQQRTTELIQKNEEVLKQNDKLEVTYKNIKLLSEIGQQITSILSLEKIIETVYSNVNNLMDATGFGIGVYNKLENRLDFPGFMEKGEKLPFSFDSLDDLDRLSSWCFNNGKEVIINDYQTEYNTYTKNFPKPQAGDQPESLIYIPLSTQTESVGVLTVQSFKKHIYSEYHLDILRTLASYITIATQNSISYEKMTRAFEDLKSAQMKMVESEKMASLGVMTAGVAHEINNPVNFISAGIESFTMNYNDFKELVHKFLAYDGKKPDLPLWEEIARLKTELDPKEMMEEMDELLESIKNGANRTSEIVKGLRNFTRLDENEMKQTNVEEGIDSTLIIINNQLKNRIEIMKEYGKVPSTMGYPGQLNQVFMNILHNAAQAIEGKGVIAIKTLADDQHVKIHFKDSGSGMSEEIRSHIFDPFFTTKEVGKGTGLGLSIAYGIIEKHKGTIEVKSEVGKGTEFIIKLPIK